jgi:hypothetical protein
MTPVFSAPRHGIERKAEGAQDSGGESPLSTSAIADATAAATFTAATAAFGRSKVTTNEKSKGNLLSSHVQQHSG